MYGTMTVSSLLPSLLLLLLTAYFQRAEAKKSEEVKDSELLGFWKQHFRDSRLKRKGKSIILKESESLVSLSVAVNVKPKDI